MKTYSECLPCSLSKAHEIASMATGDEALLKLIMRRTLEVMLKHDLERSPPEICEQVHLLIHELSGCLDPFLAIKRQYNQLVLDMLPRLMERIEGARDPFDMAVRLALAGNIIDFGTPGEVSEELVWEEVERSSSDPIYGIGALEMASLVEGAESILYVGDNAGEIVFDRLLIERLGPEKVTFAVRGGPVLNDVTRIDAAETGLADLVPIVDSGLRLPGVVRERVREELRQAMDSASLVIAKGQGNYETLSDCPSPTLFLFKVKCPCVARYVNLPLGGMVIEGRNLASRS